MRGTRRAGSVSDGFGITDSYTSGSSGVAGGLTKQPYQGEADHSADRGADEALPLALRNRDSGEHHKAGNEQQPNTDRANQDNACKLPQAEPWPLNSGLACVRHILREAFKCIHRIAPPLWRPYTATKARAAAPRHPVIIADGGPQ